LFLLGAGSLTLSTVFALLFRDYQTIDFIPRGIACLTAGLVAAVPTALAIWFVMRRGFTVNPVTAGMIAGTLAGLAGITMLELHCPNFEVFHVMLWHTAVVLVSGAAGAILGKLTRFTTRDQRVGSPST
jgi:fructose-specific phosphotransferase system IIC component